MKICLLQTALTLKSYKLGVVIWYQNRKFFNDFVLLWRFYLYLLSMNVLDIRKQICITFFTEKQRIHSFLNIFFKSFQLNIQGQDK